MTTPRQRRKTRFLKTIVTASAAVALATMARVALIPILGYEAKTIIFVFAVAASAAIDGIWAGCLATVMSALVSNYLFFAPTGVIDFTDQSGVVALSVFVIEGLFVSLLFERLHRSRRDEELAARSAADSERWLVSIVDAIPEAVFVKDRQGRMLLVNRNYERLFNLERTYVIGKTDHELFSSEEADAFWKNDLTVLQTEQPLKIEESMQICGEPRTLLSVKAPLKDSQGQVVAIISVALDITESKIAQKELQDIVRWSPYAIMLTNFDGTILVWNDAAESLFGWKREEVVGKHAPVVPAEFEAEFRNHYEHAIRGEKVTNMETHRRTKDGRLIDVSVSVAALHGPDGEPDRILAMYTDITEARRLARENLELLKREKRANESKSQFLANMSHEIRTPLGVILGMTELAKEISHGRTELDQYLTTIERNSRQLARLVDDVLDLSKVEADALDIENLHFSLSDLLHELYVSHAHSAESKGLRFSVNKDPDVPTMVVSDPTRLRQILNNLIGNAIKFTDQGDVIVTARRDLQHPSYIRFFVKDTGIGLSAEQRERLFKPFSQADASTTRRFGGTGLGLALSRRLAQALGGDLRITESAPGRGSTFCVTINGGLRPESRSDLLAVDAAQKTATPKQPKATPLAGLDVLVVDDSEDNRTMIQRFLEGAGARVEMASNGAEGIEMALRHPHHALLMDIQMPGMDGYEATAQLRKHGYSEPIIALTAHAMKGDRERAMSSGFDQYLTKPVSRTKLIESLSSLDARQMTTT